MKKLLVLSVLLPVMTTGQVWEDFSDGDFTHDPRWEGNVSHFKISSSTAVPLAQRPALQLDAPAAGHSYLSVDTLLSGALEWHCWIKMSLNTSSGNFARYYLLSDTTAMDAGLRGYFLQIGGAEDSVFFCRQDGDEITRLVRLENAYTGNSTNALRFRVIRDAAGFWEFHADIAGGAFPEPQGNITDLTYPDGTAFGIYCLYTASNTAKFYFDDFYAGPRIIDTLAPSLTRIQVMNPGELLLVFDEAVDPAVAENILNYNVIPGDKNPYSAIRMLDPEQVRLFFDPPLENGISYQLHIQSMSDLSGNESGWMSFPFLNYQPKPYDVIITEIMADPSPPFGLPEFEYLELHNRSPFDIDLENWSLQIASSIHILPACILKPSDYLLITGLDGAAVYQHFGQVAGFSSFSLANSGATVRLAAPDGNTVCHLQYDISWYRDDSKSGGGWSLEMIDTGNPCLGEVNWSASVHTAGGTPGRENSWRPYPDHELKAEALCVIGPGEIEITFNQSLDSLSASETWRYTASPDLGAPDSAAALPHDFRKVRLFFSQDILSGENYTLAMASNLVNCAGEEMPLMQAGLFALAGPVAPFDVVLNEILFNPLGEGVDYVEIVNRSGNVIDLGELLLATVKETPPNPPDTHVYAVSSSCRLLFPEEYLALTSDPVVVKSQYHAPFPEAFLKMNPFPSYNNDQGFALLMNREGLIIDGFHYHEDMHYLLLNSVDGVALERIAPDRLGDVPDNWHSAAEAVGFGTPGYRNSQYLPMGENTNAEISVHPELFSPDGDGYNDQLGIAYAFDAPGKLVTVMIFNSEGMKVKLLVNNEMAGTTGVFSWDGTLDDRTPGPNGIYVVYLEALGMDGKTRRYKKACVLSRNR